MPGSRAGPPRASGARRVALLVTLLGLIGAVSFIGDAAGSVLLDGNRLALVALTPRSAYIVAAARDVPCPLLLLVAVARLSLADPVHFMLGPGGRPERARPGRTDPRARLARPTAARHPRQPLGVSGRAVPHGQDHVRGRRTRATRGSGRCRQHGGHGRAGPGRVDGGGGRSRRRARRWRPCPSGRRHRVARSVRRRSSSGTDPACASRCSAGSPAPRARPPIPPPLRESPCGRPPPEVSRPPRAQPNRRRTRPRRETT